MQKDVHELRDRYNQQTTLGSANNRPIQINCQWLVKLDRHVSDLGLYVNQLKLGLNEVLATIDSLYHFMVFNQALYSLENEVISLLHTNQHIMSNLVDAKHGRMIPSVFPVKHIMDALEIREKEYGLTHLFDIRGIHHYYPLLTSSITTNDIVTHVAFQPNDVFEVYELEPFPFAVNGSLMTLDLPPSIVLISAEFYCVTTGSHNDLQKCGTEYWVSTIVLLHCSHFYP